MIHMHDLCAALERSNTRTETHRPWSYGGPLQGFRSIALAWLLLFGASCLTFSAQAAGTKIPALPSHPRLLFNPSDLPKIHERIQTRGWARQQFASMRASADDWLKRDVTLPDRGGQWYHYYSCPKHGARLRTEGPHRHVCPIDGEVFTGYPYDDVVITGQHDRLAEAIRTLGVLYQVTGREAYAAKAKEILLSYAAKYRSYPLHNIRGEAKVGGGKVGPQTLDESTWLITVVEGADCIWDTLSEAEQTAVKDGLLYPATDVIRQHKIGIHNIQCWKNSAVGLTGLLIGDRTLIEEALDGPSGFHRQVEKGIGGDGAWFEGAWGYHFYTISALLHLTEGAFHCGINLYTPALKKMFDAPLDLAMPDLRLPAFNDSHTISVTGYASRYEIALAHYGDSRYAAVLERGGRKSDAALLYGAVDLPASTTHRTASGNYPASGFAILAGGHGEESTWFCLDYGPHGGGHGHPDKLGFVLYSAGEVIAPDPGTANYGIPIQGGWYRTTLAHNTLTVDEHSQQPAEGKCEAFIATNGFSAVCARAGDIGAGIHFCRTAALFGERLLVVIDQVSADREHLFDLAYHNRGRVEPVPGSEPFELPDKRGYSYLRDARAVTSNGPFRLEFAPDQKRSAVEWMMAGNEPTTFITGTGVGDNTEDRVPLVIARRKAKKATFLWAVALDGRKEFDLRARPVQLAGGQEAPSAQAAAVEVRTPTGTHVLVANPDGLLLEMGGTHSNARILHLIGDGAGWREVH